MAYLVLARKYRPLSFDEVAGQEQITEVLKNAVTADRVAHAYLFCGPRGIGKTSCARILAKSLNCQNGPTTTPCGACTACKEITSGTSFDVLEIDGASNRGIDEIRAIRENVKFSPSCGRYKIYIVDEVHMLTMEAFNALLKTLEEPPEHVKFIFATTDPNRVPATIISRCQRFDFKRLPIKLLVESFKAIALKEHIVIDDNALFAIAKAAQGSFRDGLSIMDQVSALSADKIGGDDIFSMLGIVETDLLFELSEWIAKKNCAETLKCFDGILDKGKDIRQFIKDLIEHFRNLMIMKIGGKSLGRLLDYPLPVKERYLSQSEMFSLPDILKAIESFIEAQDRTRVTEIYRTPLEIAFARIAYSPGKAVSMNVPARTEAKPALGVPASAPPRGLTAAAPKAKANVSGGKFIPGAMLKNQKGEISALNAADAHPQEEKKPAPPADGPASLDEGVVFAGADWDLKKIKESWNALTHSVSRHKMFLATYLQEGVPTEFEGGVLTVSFPVEYQFHKETLEDKAYVQILEGIFTEKLNTKVMLKYRLVQGQKPAAHEDKSPLVNSALKAFEGKIISEWHND